MPRLFAICIVTGIFIAAWFIHDATKTRPDREAVLDMAARIIVADAKCPDIRFDAARAIPFLSRRGMDEADLRSPEFTARVAGIETMLADDTEHARFCIEMRSAFGPGGTIAQVMIYPEAALPPIN